MRHFTLIFGTVSVLSLAGCPGLDLGEAPFFCHNGNPACPEGYTCERVDGKDVCVKEGSQPPPLVDGSVPDLPGGQEGLTPLPDGPLPPPPDGKPPVDAPPTTPGTVVVSEIMANPKAVTDTDGEWLELFNPGSQPVDINGWTLRDKGTDSHVITAGGGLTVPAKGYLLIGRSTDKLLNGGVNVVYAYADFFLANTEDEVELVDATGKVVDSFSYSAAAGFTIPDGAGLSVKGPGVDKNNAANWCVEPSPWPGSKGDKGTPGANPGC